MKRSYRGISALPKRPAAKYANPTPLVMLLALLPSFGGVAYLASAPMISKIFVRLILGQAAWRMSFKLYLRTHNGRWLGPPVKAGES